MGKAEQKQKTEEGRVKELDKFRESEIIKNNIKEAEKMRRSSRLEKWKWMYDNFRTGEKYDVKYGNPVMEYVGNFNYGAMGRAVGLSEFELKSGAGYQQLKDGTSDINFLIHLSGVIRRRSGRSKAY